MSSVPQDLLYTKEHEWVRVLGEGGICVVGITDYAQSKLGDVVVIDLPKVGSKLAFMQTAATIESYKAVSDIYSPLTGEVKEVNPELSSNPGLVNAEPYAKGWLFKLAPSELGSERAKLLGPDSYANLIAGLS
jgi:glycine cleavage system H protein